MGFPQRSEIWTAKLDPVVGHEIGKTRPVLVISNNRNNEFSETVTILPITSKTERIYPHEISLIKGEANLSKNSKIKADQIRTLDKERFTKLMGSLSEQRMKQIQRALQIHLGFY